MTRKKIRVKIKRKDKPIDEHRGESLCDGDFKDRKTCQDRDRISREWSRERTAYHDKVWPGKRPLDQLSVGVSESKKKIKPLCNPGNPRRDADGKFGSKSDNTSFTVSNPEKKGDCSWGQSSMDKGSNKRKITNKDPKTKRCGRDKHDGKLKSKFKCKDGEALWEEEESNDDPWIKVKKSAFERLIGASLDSIEQDEPFEIVEAGKNTLQVQCNSRGFLSIKQWLRRLDAYNQAEVGKLFDKGKSK